MSRFQPNPVRSLSRGASVARGLNSARTIAQSVLDATIYYEGDEQVLEVQAGNAERVNHLQVKQGQRLWIVASKFEHRYYLVTAEDACSASDARVAGACVAKVQAYRIRQNAA